MNDEYNGWYNYETWRVQLDYFSDSKLSDFVGNKLVPISEIAEILKENVEEMIESTTKEGSLARAWAMSFVDAVRWLDIVDYLVTADNEAEFDEGGEEE